MNATRTSTLTNTAFRRTLVTAGLVGLLAVAAPAQSLSNEVVPGNWVFGTDCATFTSVDDFIAALNGRPFELEDFESHPLEMTIPDGTIVNGVTYHYLGGFGIVDGLVGNYIHNLDTQSLYYDKDSNGTQNSGDFFYSSWRDKLVVTFPQPVRAAGMHFNVATSATETDYVIMEAAGETARSGGGSELWSPPGSGFFFVGMMCNEAFTQATFYCSEDPPPGFGFNLDNLYWVPAESCDPCDMNCDGEINAFDIEPFLELLFGPRVPCAPCTGDVNGDGVIDAFDIEPFLNCLFP